MQRQNYNHNPPILSEQIKKLNLLLSELKKSADLKKKMVLLQNSEEFKKYCEQRPAIKMLLKNLSPEKRMALMSLIVIEQAENILGDLSTEDHKLEELLDDLLNIETVYSDIGGIVGYHVAMLKLITQKVEAVNQSQHKLFLHPPGVDLETQNEQLNEIIRWGIDLMPHIAEMYPVGGAGDRLDLHDDKTKEALPAAMLAFCGLSLLEGLIRDLQAREYLYFKIHGEQICTPVAIMTSREKDNDRHIREIFVEKKWFGRPQHSYRFFMQPLVPLITSEGTWVSHEPMTIAMKPGGHGVIWKLAENSGIIGQMIAEGYPYALVRQINNPMASIDYGLSAFTGIGAHFKKKFGFASCPRLLNATEGMDLLVEVEEGETKACTISNIEYTDFEQHGLKDHPAEEGSPYSTFPANTNILFADLSAVQEVLKKCPIPGMLINMKTLVQIGGKELHAGRLESTMQNISDGFIDHFPLDKEISWNDLNTFLTYNNRQKTISVTKKSYTEGGPLSETPEGCFYDLMKNYRDLFVNHCKFEVAELNHQKRYLEEGPGFIILFHPALGPFFSIIAQKIQHGKIAYGSELQLEISELSIEHLDLEGSLIIQADNLMGKQDKAGLISYGEWSGKAILKNVTVRNSGIERNIKHRYWKNQIKRNAALEIKIHGFGEFVAENVEFAGDFKIVVNDGEKVTAYMEGKTVKLKVEKIDRPTWHWEYGYAKNNGIILKRVIL